MPASPQKQRHDFEIHTFHYERRGINDDDGKNGKKQNGKIKAKLGNKKSSNSAPLFAHKTL